MKRFACVIVSYGPKATITLVRRQIFAALVDAMKEVEEQQCR